VIDYTPKIPKCELIHGAYYTGRCRNATVARWNANEQVFYHWRTKFTMKFIEEINCPEDETQYDVFVAESVCDEPEEVIPFKGDKK